MRAFEYLTDPPRGPPTPHHSSHTQHGLDSLSSNMPHAHRYAHQMTGSYLQSGAPSAEHMADQAGFAQGDGSDQSSATHTSPAISAPWVKASTANVHPVEHPITRTCFPMICATFRASATSTRHASKLASHVSAVLAVPCQAREIQVCPKRLGH